MATDFTSRASMDNHWNAHGEKGGKSRAERKLNTLFESQRKTAGDEAVKFYSARNLSIVPEDTYLNIDFTNDGNGGFREAKSPEETLRYGESRLQRVSHAVGPKATSWITSVFHLPYSLCEEIPDHYERRDEEGRPILKPDGTPAMRSRWVVKPGMEDEARRYFDEALDFFGEKVLPGGQAAIHGGSINLDESRPHMQIISDPLMTDPRSKDPVKDLKSGFSLAMGSHRKSKMIPKTDKSGAAVLGEDGSPVMRRENASDKAERHHRELKEWMLDAGFDIEAERDAKRHNRRVDLQDFLQIRDREAATADEAGVAQEMFTEAAIARHEAAAFQESAEDTVVSSQELTAEWEKTEMPKLERLAKSNLTKKYVPRWKAKAKRDAEAEVREEMQPDLDAAAVDCQAAAEALSQARAREAALARREDDMGERESELERRETVFEQRERSLSQRESVLGEREEKASQLLYSAKVLDDDAQMALKSIIDIRDALPTDAQRRFDDLAGRRVKSKAAKLQLHEQQQAQLERLKASGSSVKQESRPDRGYGK